VEEPRWVPRVVVDSIHVDQRREHGGLAGVRDENALEAALARARQQWSYEPTSELASLGAAYAFGLARAHPFSDGNKRTAFLTMMTFLGLNGKELSATEVDVVQMMVALAGGEVTESVLADWIRPRLIPLSL
jgi:death-on-curing protein